MCRPPSGELDAGTLGTPPADGATIRLTQPEAGTLCLSGTDPKGGTRFVVGFPETSIEMLDYRNFKVVTRFNAQLKQITGVKFTIDLHPPLDGVEVSAATLHSDDCTWASACAWEFKLPNPITESGT